MRTIIVLRQMCVRERELELLRVYQSMKIHSCINKNLHRIELCVVSPKHVLFDICAHRSNITSNLNIQSSIRLRALSFFENFLVYLVLATHSSFRGRFGEWGITLINLQFCYVGDISEYQVQVVHVQVVHVMLGPDGNGLQSGRLFQQDGKICIF